MKPAQADRGKAYLPPRWFIEAFWHVHRRIVQASHGRKGLWPPRPGKWGALRLTTTGRHSGEPRSVILGYYEDGPNLVSMAMNGWGAAEPAWWLNLQADPHALVELAGGIRREVLGRPAAGGERERLWQHWRELDKNLDSYAARRTRETAVVVLEPRAAAFQLLGSTERSSVNYSPHASARLGSAGVPSARAPRRRVR
jgi:deazaflavin-dependent oxidoreductase (nitroreductase family)